MYIERYVDSILDKALERKEGERKIVILLGSRQVGKTTSCMRLYERFEGSKLKFVGDNYDVQNIFGSRSLNKIEKTIKTAKFIFIDEAQKIPYIGEVLKLIHDNFPHVRVLATGSSSFGLASKTFESMAGRCYSIDMFPLTYDEIIKDNRYLSAPSLIDSPLLSMEDLLIYGMYPEVFKAKTEEIKKELLSHLNNSLLFKDILEFEGIKKPKLVAQLALKLAIQIGSQSSINNIATELGVSRITIEKYIDIMEKAFIIFTLPAYTPNRQGEVKRQKKYYLWDMGIRSSIMHYFNPFRYRNDKGLAWENFVVIEFIKKIRYYQPRSSLYYWKKLNEYEVDLIQEIDQNLIAYEIKFKGGKKAERNLSRFQKDFPGAVCKIINVDNFESQLKNIEDCPINTRKIP